MSGHHDDMNTIGKALILPLGIAVLATTAYCWKMIHVWPPGKESWLEEGLYMMAFDGFCLFVILPTLIWSITRYWKETSKIQRAILITSSVLLLALTVTMPEWIVKNTERRKPNKSRAVDRGPAITANDNFKETETQQMTGDVNAPCAAVAITVRTCMNEKSTNMSN
jgi:hypothetical protein